MVQERQAIIDSASQDLSTDSRNIASLDKGECIVSSNFAKFAIPIKVPFSEKISAVAAGLHFSLALSESGSVYAWGWNGFGQLGLSDYKDRTLPTKIKGLAKVKSISAGHTYAVATTSKELLGWGNNNSGQIGGTAAKVNSPDSFLSIA